MEETRVLEELQAVRDVVERLTGLRSRWSGSVVLMDSREIVALKGYPILAEKRWNCDIVIDAAVTKLPTRWRTYVHEMLHSISVGLNEADYNRFRGWEEGVVEHLQRLLRPEVLAAVGAGGAEAVSGEMDAIWRMNPYVQAMETLRLSLGVEALPFYRRLLAVPLADRMVHVSGLNDSPEFRRLFVYTIGKLR